MHFVLLFSLFSLLLLPFSTDGLFSWSRAVQIRTNLDLVLDWLQGAGLGDIASEFMKKLSITVNFLCIPKTRLIQVTWLHVQQRHLFPLLWLISTSIVCIQAALSSLNKSNVFITWFSRIHHAWVKATDKKETVCSPQTFLLLVISLCVHDSLLCKGRGGFGGKAEAQQRGRGRNLQVELVQIFQKSTTFSRLTSFAEQTIFYVVLAFPSFECLIKLFFLPDNWHLDLNHLWTSFLCIFGAWTPLYSTLSSFFSWYNMLNQCFFCWWESSLWLVVQCSKWVH